MQIQCRDCEMYQTSHCDDCLVTALLHPPEGIVELDDDLEDSVELLQGSGLLPVLKFRPRQAPTPPADGLTDTG